MNHVWTRENVAMCAPTMLTIVLFYSTAIERSMLSCPRRKGDYFTCIQQFTYWGALVSLLLTWGIQFTFLTNAPSGEEPSASFRIQRHVVLGILLWTLVVIPYALKKGVFTD